MNMGIHHKPIGHSHQLFWIPACTGMTMNMGIHRKPIETASRLPGFPPARE